MLVNYRCWDDLERCLESLAYLHATGQPETEVIVVDNDSADGRLDRFASRFPDVQWIRNAGNFGFANGCNRGADAATGEQLLFLNPDCTDPDQVLGRFWQECGDQPGIWTLRQVDQDGRPTRVFDAFPTAWNLLGPVRAVLRLLFPARYPDARRPDDGVREVDWVSGSALMISRRDFQHLGGWSDDFWMYSEDVDLCRRARRAALPVRYWPGLTITHRHGGSSRSSPEVTALTKTEVVISKHLYAHRNLGFAAAGAFHGLLFVSRFLPRALTAAVAWLLPSGRLRIAADIGYRLARYYGQVIRHRSWISPRSVRHPGRESENPEA